MFPLAYAYRTIGRIYFPAHQLSLDHLVDKKASSDLAKIAKTGLGSFAPTVQGQSRNGAVKSIRDFSL